MSRSSGSAQTGIEQAKQEVRRRVWALLDQHGAGVSSSVMGKIPNFVGADAAADQLAALPEWRAARVVKANPDKAQHPVRARALTDLKRLYMAVPRLAEELPFYELDPQHLGLPPAEAASSRGAATAGRKVAVEQMPPVDVVVCGSVAVNREGVRLGKGAGFSDLEVAMLNEAGLLGPRSVLATTVHRLQVVDGPLPEAVFDFRVDVIATPDGVIWCGHSKRPGGIAWEHLTPQKIAEIPALGPMRPT